jgi:hypothetical protein
MAIISFGVAAISFGIGVLVRQFFCIEALKAKLIVIYNIFLRNT